MLAWQVTSEWTYEPDVARSSEVEITLTEEPGGFTRVDLEHRAFERMGAGAQGMRGAVDSPNGWGMVLRLFQEEAER